jgi:arginyl-tRNA--protein-N-Asp/Glu arginylyltransferase
MQRKKGNICIAKPVGLTLEFLQYPNCCFVITIRTEITHKQQKRIDRTALIEHGFRRSGNIFYVPKIIQNLT